jgi:hypothetical protein
MLIILCLELMGRIAGRAFGQMSIIVSVCSDITQFVRLFEQKTMKLRHY